MALPISEQLLAILEDTVKKPQLIVEIEGLPTLSSIPTQKFAVYGDEIFYGDAGLVYGGLIDDPAVLPYIDLAKSTNQITQQMLVDKGGFSSVTSFDVSIVDKNQMISGFITPGNTIDDILAQKAKVFLSFEGASHPQDSVLFFSGIVAGVKAGPGHVNINIASPEKLKSLEIFPKLSTELTALLDNTATTISVTSTDNFVLPADGETLRTYLLLNDEIIEYTGKTETTFTGCVRGCFGTIPGVHEIQDNIESAYRLQGNVRDLCLKLMLSGVSGPYVVNEPVISFNTYGDITVNNCIHVARYNFDQYYGTVPGDIITISGDSNPSNNGATTVLAVVNSFLGSYLVLDKDLITSGSGATFSISSKYNLLPRLIGLEMTPDQVDVAEFERKYAQFSASFFEYDFFIKEPVNGSEFINSQILFPSGAYALPRKAKTSVGLTIPPLAQSGTVKLDSTNVISADRIQIDRNISKNFANAVVYKFGKDQVTDKYTSGKIRQSSNSTNRIKIANKPMTIESDGIRNTPGFESKFNIQGRRLLDRYQYAAESMDVEVKFGTGFRLEIGDSIIFDGSALNVTDTKSGNATRNFQPRLFEIQNKSMSLMGKPVRLSLVDTAMSLNGRYGVVSPSSKLDSGSTTSTLKLKKSFGSVLGFSSEGSKWRNYIGSRVRIKSRDYAFDHEAELVAIDPANDDGIIIEPALPSAPLENYIVDIVSYPDNSNFEDQAIYKAVFCFLNAQLRVVTGVSQTQFTLSSGALSKIAVGYQAQIHSVNYSYQSPIVNVIDIAGATITVDGALGFTPQLGDRIEFLGFKDGGKPYLLL